MVIPIVKCPVPLDQMPLNEYRDLQASWFYGWCSGTLTCFTKRLIWIGGFGCLISGPIAAYSFPPDETFGHFFIATIGGAMILVSLVLLKLYLGWLYVNQRLMSKTIAYEETGWYDGQSWTKTDGEMTQDQLVSQYQIKPILQRLYYGFGTLSLLTIAEIIVWQLI